jgi:hypothetical protein
MRYVGTLNSAPQSKMPSTPEKSTLPPSDFALNSEKRHDVFAEIDVFMVVWGVLRSRPVPGRKCPTGLGFGGDTRGGFVTVLKQKKAPRERGVGWVFWRFFIAI